MSIERIIDTLPEAALRELCARHLYEPSEHADAADLRRTVQHAYFFGDIPGNAIASAAEALATPSI
jgi:hypothetical protein